MKYSFEYNFLNKRGSIEGDVMQIYSCWKLFEMLLLEILLGKN